MTKTNKPQMEAAHNPLQNSPIAIIGMSSIYAQAKNLTEYWDNILNKIDAVTDVPESRWNIADYYDPDPHAPDKSYCKRGGFIPDIDFDPTEFGLPPNILEVTDVSQLLGLVVAKDALEDAGYGEDHPLYRETTGCILGVVGVSSKIYVPLTARLQAPVWERVLRNAGLSEGDTAKVIEKFKLAYVGWEENSFPGSLTNVVAGRIANRFDLGGTNCVIDAACGTALAAIRMAVMELVEGRADMMITGGVDTDNSIGVYMSFSKTPAFSKGQSVRTFDADSDGMMAGEGLGMVVLKRLADAERDGDRIYAVIRGIGASSDGRYKSIYAPRPGGQTVALRRAYTEAGYEPGSVGLIEAHGTGTPAGDPAEFQGLRDAFTFSEEERQSIAIGSVKSQIAHTKGAAGVAGLIKIALAAYHKILPPTINVRRPNPKLNVENSAFYINTETRPWFRRNPGLPRRAGVSAFGFGGTNFHVTLEEYEAEHSRPYRAHTTAQAILLAAATPAELLTLAGDALTRLQGDPESQMYNQLVRQSAALAVPQDQARIGFVAASKSEAVELLQTALDSLRRRPLDEAWEHPKGIFYRKNGLETKGKVVALFSGQGSQYLNMGRELACNFPPFRQAISQMDAVFTAGGLQPLSNRIYPRPVFSQEEHDSLAEVLTQTEHAQPAIGSVSLGLYKLLQQAGFAPDFVAGHSFGELTALWAAGVLSETDYYTLAKARGKAMAPPADPNFDPGAMLAVKGDADAVKAELAAFPEITLANWNSTDQLVLAGKKPALAALQAHLAAKGFSVVPLPVSAAFHTPLVEHAQKPFAQALRAVTFSAPNVRLFSNTSGGAHSTDPREIRRVLETHILNPVLFKTEIENIYAEGGTLFIEFGPKNVLVNLVKSILSGRPHLAVALNPSPKKDSDRQLREAVVQLRVAGLNLGDIDPYQLQPADRPQRKKSPVTVKLNGGAYVSPKTRAAFETALNDGWKITPTIQVKEVVIEKTISVPQPAPSGAPIPGAATLSPQPPQQTAPAPAPGLESSLEQYSRHQSETLKLHEQFLKNEELYAGTFARLSELEISLAANAAPDQLAQLLPVLESLERSMARFHDHQAETLRVHGAYLKSQEEFAVNFVRLANEQTAPVSTPAAPALIAASTPAAPVLAAAPVPALAPAPKAAEILPPKPASAPLGNGHHPAPAAATAQPAAAAPVPAVLPLRTAGAPELTTALLEVVSEKTGYPLEMLELDSDMESDLGIDSIKRVEIMGAVRERFPNLPKADPEAFAEVRTLGQTVEYLLSSSSAGEPAVETPAQAAIAAPASIAPASSGQYSAAELTPALLQVVSEKTGYPAEMLDLDTDMESDLGIDSIKRVEIMGAMRELFPELPKPDAETFSEVRTLGQTVRYMLATPAEAPIDQSNAGVRPPAASLPLSAMAELSTAPGADSPALPDANDLTQALLAIVSEKTGYPAEMLELDTDMESDLGIDSIKRVEILGALREAFPNLPKADPEAFTEVRTLGQIIAYMTRETSAPTPSPASPEKAAPADPSIPRGLVMLKDLPAPDALEFTLPDGSICLITDNGTRQTADLAHELARRGWKTVVLSFPGALIAAQEALSTRLDRVQLEDMSEEQLQSCLEHIAQTYGPVGGLIHLHPPFSAADSDALYSGSEKQILKHVFLLAKHLKPALGAAARAGNALFMAVAQLDGRFGLGDQADYSPVGGGLFGLIKTLNLEWEAVYCKALDISPEISAADFTGLVTAEIFDPNRRIIEVGYTPAGRATLINDPAEMQKVIA